MVFKMGKKKGPGGRREGAGRKPGIAGPVKIVTVSIPISAMERLEAIAEEKGWGRSRAVTEAVQAFLKGKAKP